MPLEQTVTIVSNSGKIISTGKQLFSIFKEAKASYDEKKAEIKGSKRSETFEQPRSVYQHGDDSPRQRGRGSHSGRSVYEPEYYTEYDYGKNPGSYDGRRRSFDVYSDASSRRSHRTSRSHSKQYHHHSTRSRPALTENNLKTLSEISSTSPSQPPMKYRSPYAETLPKDMIVSRMNLDQYDMKSVAEDDWRRSALLRRASESEMARRSELKGKEIDMNLAYGNIPPDLEYRVDLDPESDEHKANQLVRKVEGFLDEAHCLQHSATSIIKHLQQKPDAAAAVALTLAELSSVVGKMSPAFLGFLKGGSPAVFALLASPQFLIGTGIAVGLTVVMFGGWKIVQRIKESQSPREAIAYESTCMDQPAPPRPRSDYNASFDEALVLDEELSTIETWRRGIMPFGADDESADIELITPEAERAHREKHKDDFNDVDSRRSARTARSAKTTTKTAKTAKTAKSSKTTTATTTKSQKSSGKDKDKERENPDRRSSRHATVESVNGDSEVSRHRASRRDKERDRPPPRERGVRMIEDGRSNNMGLVFRPKAQRQGDNMLKALFKNNDKQESMAELVLA
ncbi:hypothetical protein ED733_005646 [Metarhizium rileyi]|uniref:Uncharacterized protein n=1 Tax=Metarhizium rileyi (strain RCEF 4871) TaxID=1649241 RepID=A0A5C6GB39_METRR|nr:hypothetical protein ED733_005646 [Metarhizium rileyi]